MVKSEDGFHCFSAQGYILGIAHKLDGIRNINWC